MCFLEIKVEDEDYSWQEIKRLRAENERLKKELKRRGSAWLKLDQSNTMLNECCFTLARELIRIYEDEYSSNYTYHDIFEKYGQGKPFNIQKHKEIMRDLNRCIQEDFRLEYHLGHDLCNRIKEESD